MTIPFRCLFYSLPKVHLEGILLRHRIHLESSGHGPGLELSRPRSHCLTVNRDRSLSWKATPRLCQDGAIDNLFDK